MSVRDTLAPSYINESSKKSRSIADNGERYKHNRYLFFKENYIFSPLAFETLGCIGPETKQFIGKLNSLMRLASGETHFKDYLFQLLFRVAIQQVFWQH